MYNLLLFAQKPANTVTPKIGSTDLTTILATILIALALFRGVLWLAKVLFPEKFYAKLDPKVESAILEPPEAEIPKEFSDSLKVVAKAITDKQNEQRQEKTYKKLSETLEKIQELHDWHKPAGKFEHPPWYCVCAMEKTKPQWEAILSSLNTTNQTSEGVKAMVEALKETHKEWSESVIETNHKVSQVMSSLIGFLQTMSERENGGSDEDY